METNIIQFPKQKLNSPAQSMEEVLTKIDLSRREHVDLFLDIMIPFVFQRAYEEGFDVSKESCLYINSLFVESLKATLLKSLDIDHELQEFAEQKMNELDNDEEDGGE